MFFRLAEKGRSLPEHGSPGISPQCPLLPMFVFSVYCNHANALEKTLSCSFSCRADPPLRGASGCLSGFCEKREFLARSFREGGEAYSFVAVQRYEYSREGSAQRVNMGQAVRYALEHNPGLGSSEAAARASEEGRKSARGALFPKLGTTYSYYKQARTTSVREASNPPSMGTYTWTVEVSQILFDGFNNLGTYQKQALQAESDRASIRSSELDTTNSVQETFIDYLCSLENVASEKEAVSRLKDQKRITGAMHDAGLKPKLDVLQADVDLGNAEQQLITYENTRDTLRAKLNTLLGIPATSPVRYAGGLSVTRFRLSLDTCLDTAYKMRPDLYVSYKAVEMAIKDRLIARSGYYPTVEAYYNVSKTGNTPDLERGGTHSSRSTTWEVGAKLTWDVFQWGTTYFADQQAGWLVSKMRKQVREDPEYWL